MSFKRSQKNISLKAPANKLNLIEAIKESKSDFIEIKLRKRSLTTTI